MDEEPQYLRDPFRFEMVPEHDGGRYQPCSPECPAPGRHKYEDKPR